ncbi:hypothetical protein FMUND_1074 [Fusarium mundagurra]|uniref:Uncharacterized protein n=1 Tax=Fusarium mundagurra TaxID=1567541 RepID=A0A8H5Z791_9HYPO|nr:hypothetical protein FMUND_1074 [Fusarium mundagurra]
MAPPCLSRLLLIVLAGASHVLAHPMNKDKPSESGSVVVQKSPSLEWKPQEEIHKHNHVHHGSQESTVIFQKITVKLDDNDGSKHKSDANGDEESTKTKYPSEASLQNDENIDTTHDYKDLKRRGLTLRSTDEKTRKKKEFVERWKKLTPYQKAILRFIIIRKYLRMWMFRETTRKKVTGYQHERKPWPTKKDFSDNKDGSKHKFDVNGDKESTKTKHPNEASSKNDKNMDTTHNHKDSERREEASKLTEEEEEEMAALAKKYKKLNKEEKKRLEDLFKKSELTKPENKDKFKKPNEYNRWVLTGYKRDEARHHKSELAPTEEKGVEKKAKIEPRCIPWWVYLIIEMERKKKAKKKAKTQKLENGFGSRLGPRPYPLWWNKLQKDSVNSKLKTKKENLGKLSNKPLGTKLESRSHDQTGKAFDKKPIEEKETQENKGSGIDSNKTDSSASQEKKDKGNKQKSDVQPNTASVAASSTSS